MSDSDSDAGSASGATSVSDPLRDLEERTGWATLTRINGTDDPRVVRQMAELSPDLARWIVEFGYGECHEQRSREVLDERQRQLTVLGALTALGGAEEQFAVHVAVALNVGLTPDEITEAVLHALPFVGFPRTIAAAGVLRRVFERRGVWPSEGIGGENDHRIAGSSDGPNGPSALQDPPIRSIDPRD